MPHFCGHCWMDVVAIAIVTKDAIFHYGTLAFKLLCR